jgi:putative heme-binding domain-containing protein
LLRLPGNEKAQAAVIAALTAEDKPPPALERLWGEFARDARHNAAVPAFVKRAKEGTAAQKELVYGVLATVADRPPSPQVTREARAAAAGAVRDSLADPTAAPIVLRALARLGLTSYAAQIRALLDSPNPGVAAAAKTALAALKLDAAANAVTVGKIKYEELADAVAKEKGAAALGAKLFERVGCANCHTTTAGESLKGPLLAGITARYTKAELIESIVKPSAKIAQGFETYKFETADGKVRTGFIVRESGTEVEIRDETGTATEIRKENLVGRKQVNVSVMPEKLVDHLTPAELASILAYLESLAPAK